MKVIDARFSGQPHPCRGCWHYLGLNPGGHEVYDCDVCESRIIAAHVAADHQCSPACELPDRVGG